MKKIFISVSSAPGSAYNIREFQKLGYYVICGDADSDCVGNIFADKFYTLPFQKEENYFDEIFGIVQKEAVDFFVPSGELECYKASLMRQRFLDMGCTVVAADSNTLEKSLDKSVLFDFLSQNTDIPMMRYHVVSNLDDFNKGLEKLSSMKLCLKPATGSGSRGFVILDDNPMDSYRFFTEKINFLHVSTDYVRSILKNGTQIPKLLLMEYIEGDHFDTNIVCKEGKILWQSCKTREQAKIGTITKGEIISNPELESINRKIAACLNTTGLVSPQYINNKLVEINPRWSTSLLYNSLHEFLYSIQVWTGETLNIKPEDIQDYLGLRMLRYWDVALYKRKQR